MTIGERMKFIRKNYNINQNRLADLLGISQTHISKIENNADLPSKKVINLFCATFNINKTWLETGIGEMSSDLCSDTELQKNKIAIQELLNCNTTKAQDKIKIIGQVLTLLNAIQVFDDNNVISEVEFLPPILNDLYQLVSYIKEEYPQIKNVQMSVEDYEKKQEEINEITEVYINNVSAYIRTIVVRICASCSFMDKWIDGFENI